MLCDCISTFDISDPTIAVDVSGDVAPVVDVALTLACNVDNGIDMITNPNVTYQWYKSRNGRRLVVPEQTQQIWSFTSLNYSDAGRYSCAVDISSTILSSTINAVSDPFNVTLSCKPIGVILVNSGTVPFLYAHALAVPGRTMVTVTGSMESPIISGIDVMLTCTVELSTDLASVSSIGVAITWTGPSGTLSSTSMPVMSGAFPPTYTGTLLLSAVLSNGTYTCQAMCISSSLYLLSSGSIRNNITITIGKMATLL